ncbi:hypothetical protein BDV25DRAFT_163061 [Aspergillus avenaceus]|uniref:Uncharacterized protein n=1 Tax=Aspergillus avenaceus TaxID=36643 RepID=A0A5N6TIH5_ASPAV|nr:hypothetical protein BDV25DRAFT_163061 [Aspergillus avenaceus]
MFFFLGGGGCSCCLMMYACARFLGFLYYSIVLLLHVGLQRLLYPVINRYARGRSICSKSAKFL